MTYSSSSVAKGASRTLIEDIDNGNNPLHQPLISIPKLLKGLGLALEYSFDGIDIAALTEVFSPLPTAQLDVMVFVWV